MQDYSEEWSIPLEEDTLHTMQDQVEVDDPTTKDPLTDLNIFSSMGSAR
jgi:hypothetical protein